MQVTIRPEGRVLELSGIRSVAKLMNTLGLTPGTVLLIDKDSQSLLTEDESLREDQTIEIRKVISGG